jgi:hypothetical protein
LNRRDFSKLCASAAMTGVLLDGTRSAAGAPTLLSQIASNDRDAYGRREGTTWIMGTSQIEQKVALENGRFLLTSFRNKRSRREYRNHGADPDQIRMRVDGVATDSAAWHWNLLDDHQQILPQGELLLEVRLSGGPLQVTKHWMMYPHTAIIREWLTIENTSARTVQLDDLFFLNTRSLGANPESLELGYLSGGGAFNGSQLLKTELVHRDYRRTFDSNIGVQKGNYSAYLPLLLLRDLTSNDSLAIGWDYMGHWSLQVGDHAGEQVGVALQVAGFKQALLPGARVTTPKAFTAALPADLDEIGNQILDWQYRYLWEFTNPDYFGKTRWAVDWPSPWIGDGGRPCADNWGRRLALDLRYTDLLREAGGDILWDDAGWYDRWGDWNGPDWCLTTSFLEKHGMRWVLWQPTFLATCESRVALAHPGWIIPGEMVFEQSLASTTAWQKQLLDKDVAAWHDFQWRYDIAPAASASDTGLLAADQEFRSLIEQFKTAHPGSGVDACDGGGRWISYDLARLAESGEYTDGGVGPYSGYYTSLLVPPDKLHNVTDFDHKFYQPSTDRIHLGLNPTWYRDPGDDDSVEAIRKDWEIYHYLLAQGVAGRWSHVFRPRVTGDDPIWYFQRMDSGGDRGIILAKHAKTGTGYLLISTPVANTRNDRWEGGPAAMVQVRTTTAATLDTGIYADPIDHEHRYYGVPGEIFGPLSFRHETAQGNQPFVIQIVKRGAVRHMDQRFFGISFQTGAEPLSISELGQFDPGRNQGTYQLTLMRVSDQKVLGSVMLDMSQTGADALGFKYATLAKPIHLEPGLEEPIQLYPRGLNADRIYEVQSIHGKLHMRETGEKLMANGIRLTTVPAGELIFLNLPDYPGSGASKMPPQPPTDVTKRVGTNLGVQGIEVAWSAARNKWIAYYEILKNGSVAGRAAKGTFFFDYSPGARHHIDALYEVRAVDGDGNRSSLVGARQRAGDPESHEALGEFARIQNENGWRYEQSFAAPAYEELSWHDEGYEGVWAGSGLGRIGRIWIQPSVEAEIARTFVVAGEPVATLSGQIQKDPSADPDLRSLVRIEHNQKQIWPLSGWATVPPFGRPLEYRVKDLRVRPNDTIRFVVKRNESQRADPIVWNPRIVLRF